MNMTYRELQEAIENMTEEQKDMNVTVYDSEIDECYPVSKMAAATENEATALDLGHPILAMAFESI